MPACCEQNCRNRAEQGFRLFRFPADQKRKKIWIKQCAKDPKGDSRYYFGINNFVIQLFNFKS